MAEAALQRSTRVDEILNSAVTHRVEASTRVAVQEADKAFASITANPFYQVIFSAETDPEAKKAAITKLLTYEGTKEENREKITAYQLFEEYMQSVREQMATEIIRLTDTDAFAELQSVYNDMNTSLIDFDNRMRPLTEIIDALYVLRTNDKTLDAFKEIQSDRETEEKNKKEASEREEKFRGFTAMVSRLDSDIAVLGETKSLWGWGGVTEAARKEIALKEVALKDTRTQMDQLQSELDQMDKAPPESSLGEFAAQKAKLRELLDITSDEHKQRQRDLVDAALNFVSTSKNRIGEVREHLDRMNSQVGNLYDANTKMTGVYAIMSDAINEADGANKELRSKYTTSIEGESKINEMIRDENRNNIEDHITALDAAASSTVTAYTDLTGQTIRIKTMRDANQQQIDRARVMHTQGTAGIADRLSVVLQAVSGAALNESSAMTGNTLKKMADSTNKVAQQEAIKQAMGVSELNQNLIDAIESMGDYKQVFQTATDIQRTAVQENKASLEKMLTMARSVQDDIKKNIAIHAETTTGTGPSATPTARTQAPSNSPNPFGIGGR